jgi:hypothetical protein
MRITRRAPLSLVPVGTFTAMYVLAAVAGALAGGNAEFIFYIVVMLALIALVLALHGRVRLPGAALWALSVWGALHMAGGLVPVPESWPIDGEIRALYSLWIVPGRLKYDHMVHAYGFGVTTWVCWLSIRGTMRSGMIARPTTGLLLLCVMAGMGFGAFNEVVEFFATRLMPRTNVGGYENTGWDLVANMTGAIIAATAIWVGERV